MISTKPIYLLILALFIPLSSFAQADKRQANWQEVYRLEKEGLTKSAQNNVEEILVWAAQESNAEELLKATIYQSKFWLLLEENAQLKVIDNLQRRIEKASFPHKSIYQLIAGKSLFSYYQSYSYDIDQRDDAKVDTVDFNFWNKARFQSEIHSYYNNALREFEKNDTLRLDQYRSVFRRIGIEEPQTEYVSDFIVEQALNFYFYGLQITDFKSRKWLPSLDTYWNPNAFLNLQIEPQLEGSSFDLGFRLIQKTLMRQKASGNTKRYVYWELFRLKLLKNRTDNELDAYLKALDELAESLDTDNKVTVLFEKAQTLNTLGARFNYKKKEDAFRWMRKEAYEICEEVIRLAPNSFEAKQAQVLKSSIEQYSLNITQEDFIQLSHYSRVLVEYNNLKSLEFTIYKGSMNRLKQIIVPNKKPFSEKFKALDLVRTWEVDLPQASDYQRHATEVLIDPLAELGQYLLVVKEKDTEEPLQFGIFQVSNLTFIRLPTTTFNEFLVSDRNTGKPISKAKVRLLSNGNYGKAFYKNLKSDMNGRIQYKSTNYYSGINAKVMTATDTAFFDNIRISRNAKSASNDNIFVTNTIFTDRAIYKPGQMMYFKGILFKTQKEKREVVPNEEVLVTVYDENDDEIYEETLKSNEFGSFTDSLKIPKSVLPGEFYIEVDESENESKFFDKPEVYFNMSDKYFRVENYKRPKFELETDPIKKAYVLGDSVTFSGKATALAGSKVSDAAVKYTVTRTGYLYGANTDFYSYPIREEFLIAEGETATDNDGKFKVTFMASGDAKESKEKLPIFSYEIEISVTDINGETRTTEKTIYVGYHKGTSSISAPVEVEIGEPISLTVSERNLNNQAISEVGTLSVYKLAKQRKYLKKRLWTAPDSPIISPEEFASAFPYEPYGEVNAEDEKVLIFEALLSSINDIYMIPESKYWEKGEYKVSFKSGTTIIQKSSLNIKIKNSSKIKDHKSFINIVNDKNTYQHKDKLELNMYTSMPSLSLTLLLDKAGQISKEYIFNLSKGEKTLRLPIKRKDIGGYSIHYLAQSEGMVETGKLNINIPFEEQRIELETTSFRSKLEPGQNETWSFKVKGDQKGKAEAELLASMYDASLDQFVRNDWYLSSISKRPTYSNGNFSMNGSFSQKSLFSLTSNRYSSFQIPIKSFYTLELFGYSFVNPRQGQNNYENISFSPENKVLISIADDEEFETLMEVPITNQALAGKVAGVRVQPGAASNGVQIRGASSLSGGNGPLIILDGKIMEGNLSDFNLQEIASYEVLKGTSAATLYGSRAANGVIILSSKGGSASISDQKQEALFSEVKRRTNFKETAFFYPQLRTNKAGEINFSFTTPESLTKWKFQLLAHTKSMLTDQLVSTVQTQKKLMVLPNFPRFVREKDQLIISVKVASLLSKEMKGKARIEWLNPENDEPIDLLVKEDKKDKSFELKANGNTALDWKIRIPEGLSGIKYRVLATANGFSDGEESFLPVLSNKVMVTESLPMWVKANEEKEFKFDALSQASNTKENFNLNIEFTNNPLWNVAQSLPYLIEFPYECSEQTFSRIFANALGMDIAKQHPSIAQLITKWSGEENQGPLFANEKLKSIALKETPWLLEAKNNEERLKNLSKILNPDAVEAGLNSSIDKLNQMQMGSGAFPWFSGGSYANRTITSHIVSGFGQLKKLGIIISNNKVDNIVSSAFKYLDNQIISDYNRIAKDTSSGRELQAAQIHYLYARSFYDSLFTNEKIETASSFFLKLGEEQWLKQGLQSKAMLALIYHRAGKKVMANKIMKSLEENATLNERGMYWLENESSFNWYHMPIETHARIMEAFAEIIPNEERHQQLMQWLIQNKRANAWPSTKATTDAIYTMLNTEKVNLNEQNGLTIRVGDVDLSNSASKASELFLRKDWAPAEIKPSLSEISIKNEGANPSWGAIHYQYFEALENVVQSGGSLQIRKEVFKVGDKKEQTTEKGHVFKIGDRVKVRLSLSTDQDMEFLHLKDLRAAGFEPKEVLSGYKSFGNAYAYQAIDDTSIHFFFDRLKKGKYVVEYELIVNNAGSFSTGIATIESMYAPEFNAKAKSIPVELIKN
ncbi:alpha-2-macroglobulin family protein [Roseivirga sp.]|uniref:alpha-2-macroglobulin family protein n=1 Tax=Roseivirga sp. TaxID=1964215 RepID=UPI003B8DAB48